MLIELIVENFAIIDKSHLQFGPGLNVLTGETGAGKSLLIDAMTVLLGGRASEEYIRAGADRAVVTAVFDITAAPAIKRQLSDAGLDDEELIITREIARGGRNVGRINERPVTVSTIREITSSLVELHGQHGHQVLLRPSTHRLLLDAWAEEDIMPLRRQAEQLYSQMLEIQEQLKQLAGDSRQRARTLDLYNFQVEEIDGAHLSPNEENELSSMRVRIANADRIQTALSESYGAVYEGDGQRSSAMDRAGAAISSLERISELDPDVHPVLELLGSATANLEEAGRLLRDQLENTQFDPNQAEQLEERWRVVNDLKRKYGGTVEEILHYRQRVADEINRLENAEELAQELEEQLGTLVKNLEQLLPKLTAQREKAAVEFAKAVDSELLDLAMPGQIKVSVTQQESPDGLWHRGRRVSVGPTGCDSVEIQLAANPGEPLRPLHRVASGGELSRIMLAIITAIGRHDGVPILIFDEIDAGIGGRTATAVADKLSAIAADRQVLCITHLPQIAARGDVHFCLEKSVDAPSGRVTTKVQTLADNAREYEIARMLAGGQSEVDLAHARSLLKRSQQFRAG